MRRFFSSLTLPSSYVQSTARFHSFLLVFSYHTHFHSFPSIIVPIKQPNLVPPFHSSILLHSLRFPFMSMRFQTPSLHVLLHHTQYNNHHKTPRKEKCPSLSSFRSFEHTVIEYHHRNPSYHLNRANDTMHSVLHSTSEFPPHTAFLSSLSFLSMIALECATNNALSKHNYKDSNASFKRASPVASTIA